MTAKKVTSKKMNTLDLTGDLTIIRADEILSQLRDAFSESRSIRVILKDVTSMDLSFLQLLCSAHRTAAAEKKTIVLDRSGAEMFQQVVRQAGFKRRHGCAYSPDSTCLCNDGDG